VIARDPRAEQEVLHDLIVIGGGVYGCVLSLEASRRGLRTLLLERDDFGQHTSGSWLRIVHGGLRYLQKLDVRRHLESVRERGWFLRSFPDLVEPLPCVMPLHDRGLRRRPVLAAGMALNDLLSARRNAGVRPDRRIPRGRILSSAEVRRRAPSVEPSGLAGGALWHDAYVPRPQRLLMEILHWATREGARAANYVEALEFILSDGAVTGVVARDRLNGDALTFRSRAVVSCTGPWATDLVQELDHLAGGLFHPSLAFNVLFDRAPDFEDALAVTADRPGARTYFLLPAYGGVLAGTYHAPASPGHSSEPGGELVSTFARELDEALPRLGLGSATPRHVFWGLLPVRRPGTIDLSARGAVHDHAARGGPRGLFTVTGVKLTVARTLALRTLGLLERRGLCEPVAPGTVATTSARYVPDARAVLSLMDHSVGAAQEVVRRIVEEEAALHADDVLSRRTDWALDAPDSAARARLVAFVEDVLSSRGAQGAR
jgi:glycerol-3-phosphate dehydrogenase